MKYIGIDNGIFGAIAVIENKQIIKLITMPIITGSNNKNEYDIQKIYDFLLKYSKNSMLIIEKAHAMPVIGVVQAFSFGKLYGIMLGLAIALKIPYTIVHAKTWQKEMFKDISSKNTKQASIQIATRLYPEQSFLATDKSKKANAGLSDATLIATYGLRKNL